ncbi:MAG: cold shock and DUF1294 domain-containing protein [Pseudomonadota bacterium]
MRFEGRLKTWNDARGFGFIEPHQGGQEIFVHITAFPAGTGKPVPNLKVSFEVEQKADGKKRAKNVIFGRPARAVSRIGGRAANSWAVENTIVLTVFALAYLVVTVVWGTSWYLAVGYFGMSLVCAFAYGMDKTAARNGHWRISESTLLFLGMIGGWPGAIVAQQTLRHKTSKVSFQVSFWFTVVINVGAFLAVTTPLLSVVQARWT